MSQYDEEMQVSKALQLKVSIAERNQEASRILGFATSVQPLPATTIDKIPFQAGNVIRRRRVYSYNADEEASKASHYWSLTKFRSNSLMFEYKRFQAIRSYPK